MREIKIRKYKQAPSFSPWFAGNKCYYLSGTKWLNTIHSPCNNVSAFHINENLQYIDIHVQSCVQVRESQVQVRESQVYRSGTTRRIDVLSVNQWKARVCRFEYIIAWNYRYTVSYSCCGQSMHKAVHGKYKECRGMTS